MENALKGPKANAEAAFRATSGFRLSLSLAAATGPTRHAAVCVRAHVKQLQATAVAQLDFSEFIDFFFLRAAISWYHGKGGASLWCNHVFNSFFFFLNHVLAQTLAMQSNAKEKLNVQKNTWRIWSKFVISAAEKSWN